MRKSTEYVVINITSQTWTVKCFFWEQNWEINCCIYVWIFTWCIWISTNISNGLSLLGRKQRFDTELDERFFYWHKTEWFKVTKAKYIDFNSVFFHWDDISESHVLRWSLEIKIIANNNERAQDLSASRSWFFKVHFNIMPLWLWNFIVVLSYCDTFFV